jgi:hypothetical protein
VGFSFQFSYTLDKILEKSTLFGCSRDSILGKAEKNMIRFPPGFNNSGK